MAELVGEDDLTLCGRMIGSHRHQVNLEVQSSVSAFSRRGFVPGWNSVTAP
jgi:hypothetical protein